MYLCTKREWLSLVCTDRPPKTNFNLKIMIARRLYSVLSWPRQCVWARGPDFSSLIFGRDDVIILHRQVVQCPLPLLIPCDYMNQKLCWPRPRLAYEAAASHLPRTHLIPGKLKILRKYHLLRWLDPVFLGGYHPTLKLSGIPTFTFIVSLTHRMYNI